MSIAATPISFPVAGQIEPPEWLRGAGVPTIRPAFAPAEPTMAPSSPGATAQHQHQVDMVQVEQQLAEAMAQAQAEGFARGEVEGRAAWEERAANLDQVVAEMVEVRRKIFGAMTTQMQELALGVAREVLKRELTQDPEYVVDLVRQAVELVVEEDEIIISVSPQDHALMSARMDEIASNFPRAGGLVLRADESVENGCVVDTRLARVDATLANRLHNIADSLNGNGSSEEDHD